MLVAWQLIFAACVVLGGRATEGSTNSFAFARAFQHLLERIYAESWYDTVFLLRREAAHCVDADLAKYCAGPVLAADGSGTIYLKGNYSSEMLAVMCVPHLGDVPLLANLAANLQHMRTSRVLVIANSELQQGSDSQLAAFFRACEELRLLNVLVLHRNYPETRIYHSYTQFPAFQLERHPLDAAALLYPNRLQNFRGKVLLTLPDQIEPTTMMYSDPQTGRQVMSGYVGKLLDVFARQHNCTLQLPFPYNMSNDFVIYPPELRLAVRNGSIDIAASLSTPQRERNIHEYTYPVEISKWVTMLPIEPAVPTAQLLISFFRIEFLVILLLECWLLSVLMAVQSARIRRRPICDISLLDIFCNDSSIRGVLGQPFNMLRQPVFAVKYIYCLTFMGGLFVSTLFSAHLAKLFTAPPTKSPIRSFDDVLQQQLKIRLAADDVIVIEQYRGSDFWRKYEPAFSIVPTLGEFQAQRRNMVLPFGYQIFTSFWWMIDQQQRYFPHKVYRLSTELYYHPSSMVFGLPLNENSVYKAPLDRLIMHVHDMGLLRKWCRLTFYDMIRLKRVTLRDPSQPRGYQQLQVGDFYWIWILYAVAMGFCTFAFVLEKFVVRSPLKNY